MWRSSRVAGQSSLSPHDEWRSTRWTTRSAAYQSLVLKGVCAAQTRVPSRCLKPAIASSTHLHGRSGAQGACGRSSSESRAWRPRPSPSPTDTRRAGPRTADGSGSRGANARVSRQRERASCQSPACRGDPFIAALDRHPVGCYRAPDTCRACHEHLYYFVDRDPVLPSRTRLAQQAGQSTLPRAMSLIRSQVRAGRLVRVAGVGRAIPTSDKRRGGYLRRSLGAPELWITDYQIHSQWPTLRRSAREARSRGLHQRGVPTRSPPDALGQWRDRPPSAAGHARCPWRFPHETIWCALGCFGEPEG